jgi:hypothetical protein
MRNQMDVDLIIFLIFFRLFDEVCFMLVIDFPIFDECSTIDLMQENQRGYGQ